MWSTKKVLLGAGFVAVHFFNNFSELQAFDVCIFQEGYTSVLRVYVKKKKLQLSKVFLSF